MSAVCAMAAQLHCQAHAPHQVCTAAASVRHTSMVSSCTVHCSVRVGAEGGCQAESCDTASSKGFCPYWLSTTVYKQRGL